MLALAKSHMQQSQKMPYDKLGDMQLVESHTKSKHGNNSKIGCINWIETSVILIHAMPSI